METHAPPTGDLRQGAGSRSEAARAFSEASGQASFRVVALGASAGGVEAVQSFFSALPARPGMAFVLVQHLRPDLPGRLADLVQARTQMRVAEVAGPQEIEPDQVYVLPPGKHLEMDGGRLHVVDPTEPRGRPRAFDRSFESLAEDAGERAVCVVLSGTGSDGAQGLSAVKARAGLTMVQDPSDAASPEMPRTAIETGSVDLTGTAAELAAWLVKLAAIGGRDPSAADACWGEGGTGSRRAPEDPVAAGLEGAPDRDRGRLAAIRANQGASQEEMPACNEGGRTTTEALQSINEELHSVNRELQAKVEELTRANADLENVVAATGGAAVYLDRDLRVRRFTPAAERLFGLGAADHGGPIERLGHRLEIDALTALARQVLESQAPIEATARGIGGEGYVLRVLPYRTHSGQTGGVVLTVVDRSGAQAAQEEALRRTRQQEAVAALGQFALGGADLQAVFDRGVALVASAAGAPMATVLRHEPAIDALRVVSGVGWSEGTVGEATVPDAPGSQAGFTLLAPGPVLVSDLGAETRFTGPPLLLAHGVRSGMSVSIPGLGDAAWGVLGVHAREPRRFGDLDGRFLESMAGVLASAIRHAHDEATIRDQLAELEAVYETAPVGLAFMGDDLRYRRINRRLAAINGAPVEAHIGRRTREVVPVIADTVEPILRGILETGEPVEDVEIRGPSPTDPDDHRVWLASYVPSVVDGAVAGVSLVVRDVTDRTRADESVQAAKGRLELAARAAHLGVFERDLRTDRIVFDERCQELFEIGTDEPVAAAFERVHPEDVAEVEALLARTLDPADPADDYTLEHRLLLPDGRVRWLSVRAEAHFDGAGPRREPRMLVGVALDITSRKATEHALTETAARLELALTGGSAGTYEVDLRTGTVVYDESAQRLLGTPPTATLTEALARVHPEDRAEVDARIRAATDPVTPCDLFRSLHRQIHPDGSAFWVVSRGLCAFRDEGPARAPVRLLGTVVDITELKEAQDAVRRQLAEIDAYFDAVPAGIAVYDAGGRFVRVNGQMETILGLEAGALVGAEPSALVPRPYLDATEPILRRVLGGEGPVRDIEMWLPDPTAPDGPLRDWLVSVVPLAEQGAVTGATLVAQDVTALKQAQEGLRALTAELEERVVLRTAQVRRLVGDLTEAERRERGRVAQVLHDDLQQLLYATQFKLQALRNPTADPAALEALFASTEDLLDRAVHVTRTLTVDLRPPVLEGEGLDATFEWLARRVEDAYGLDVTVVREETVTAGKTVQVLLFQIVRELLFNVVKHAGTNEAVVRVGPGDEGRVQVSVIDEGIGFDPGTTEGVGLASLRERIGLVGGAVEVVSEPGVGTRVTIDCPRAL